MNPAEGAKTFGNVGIIHVGLAEAADGAAALGVVLGAFQVANEHDGSGAAGGAESADNLEARGAIGGEDTVDQDQVVAFRPGSGGGADCGVGGIGRIHPRAEDVAEEDAQAWAVDGTLADAEDSGSCVHRSPPLSMPRRGIAAQRTARP